MIMSRSSTTLEIAPIGDVGHGLRLGRVHHSVQMASLRKPRVCQELVRSTTVGPAR